MAASLSMAILPSGVESSAPSVRIRAINARSVDAPFLRRLKAGHFRGHVHSVFDRVVNFEDQAGELFTLACREVDNGPNTIVADIDAFARTGVGLMDRVTGHGNSLAIGGPGIELLLTAATAWEGCLPAYPGSSRGLSAQLRFARACLGRHGRGGGMVAKRDCDSEFARAMMATLQRRSKGLLQALARADFEAACRHAKSMIGLGPGLTPSGDDFLVGLFAVLNLAGSPCQGWLGCGADIVAGAERSTNAISLAALTQAANGRVRESIVALIEALLHGTAEDLHDPLCRVLAIGSTSGSDLVAGVLAGLELNLQVSAWRADRLTPVPSSTPACHTNQFPARIEQTNPRTFGS